MIVTFCNEKGGAGKSSLSQTMAVYLQVEKNMDVLLVDADPQRTSAMWAEDRRESDLTPISCVQLLGAIAHDLADLSDKYDAIVVDCSGADSKAMRAALTITDIAVVPFRPKRRDLKQAENMAEILDEIKAINNDLRIVSVITQAPTLPSQAYRIENAKKLLSSFGLNPLRHITRSLNDWDDAEELGNSVIEYDKKSKAREDAFGVFTELEEVLKNG